MHKRNSVLPRVKEHGTDGSSEGITKGRTGHLQKTRYAMELIRALLEDEVNLNWSLEQQHDKSYQVTKRVLPRL
jgi:hypothetical protein